MSLAEPTPPAGNEPSSPAPPEPPPRAAPRSRATKAGAAAVGLGALLKVGLAKLQWLFVGLKFLKLGKIATTALTMAVSIAGYALLFGAPFAVGFVLLILLHELGHGAAMRYRGLRASAPVFIPFFGAFIAMRDLPRNVRIEAEVAIAGPLAGALASAACFALGAALRSPLLLALAHTGFVINLFNLLPVSPLDGGRVAGALSRKLWIAGLLVAVPLAFAWSSPLLFVIVLLGAFRLYNTWRAGPEHASYFDIPDRTRLALGALYFGLAAALALATFAVPVAAGGPRSATAAGSSTGPAKISRATARGTDTVRPACQSRSSLATLASVMSGEALTTHASLTSGPPRRQRRAPPPSPERARRRTSRAHR